MNDSFPNSALIRPRPSRKQPLTHWQKHSAYRRQKTKRSAWLLPDSPLWPVMLLLAVMLLAGCHTQPVKPCVEPAIPTVPVLQQPLPKETYSASVLRDLSKWQKMLTDTPQTSKP